MQESAPEREALKRELLARASRAAAPDAIFASSTSGLLPSRLQADMAHPERFTRRASVQPRLPAAAGRAVRRRADRAGDGASAPRTSTARLGMRPLVLRTEVDAFVADRLLEALWREALWLVADDVATVEEIDDAIRFGAGLRWAFMGTFLTYRIAGGEAGMRHFMAQFGPALAAALDEADGRARSSPTRCSTSSSRSPTRRRPGARRASWSGCATTAWCRCCRALQGARRRRGRRARRVRAGAARARARPAGRGRRRAAAAARRRRRARVDRLQRPRAREPLPAGVRRRDRRAAAPPRPRPRRRATTTSPWRRTCRTSGRRARASGSERRRRSSATTPSGCTSSTRCIARPTTRLLATAEQMLLHVDAATGRAAPAAPAVLERVAAIAAAHAALPRPERAGRAIGLSD